MVHACNLSVEDAEAEEDTILASLVYIMGHYLSKQTGKRAQPMGAHTALPEDLKSVPTICL